MAKKYRTNGFFNHDKMQIIICDVKKEKMYVSKYPHFKLLTVNKKHMTKHAHVVNRKRHILEGGHFISVRVSVRRHHRLVVGQEVLSLTITA